MSAHSLFKLTSKLYNTPHLITHDALNVVLDYLDVRNSESFQLATYNQEPKELETVSTLGVLKIDGSLTYKPVASLCSDVGTSYTSLVQDVEAMAEMGIKTIIMEVTSGGGEAGHCFETAEDIRAICDENGIELIGYADTMAASAAYALIAVCDEVIANPSASLGSIGCVVALMDTSKAMAEAGLKRIFITSGASKVPFAEDGSFKKEFLADIQKQVDGLNAEFAQHVSKYTGLSVEDIKGFEAKVFNAQEALDKGLANKIMTNKQFTQYIADKAKGAI